MIDCPNGEIRDLLPEFVHGKLTGDTHRVVELHVAGCEPCTDEAALLRQLGTALATTHAVNVTAIVAALPAPPAHRPKLVRTDAPRRTASRPLLAQPWLRYAAAIVFVAGAGSLLMNRTGIVSVGPTAIGAAVATSSPDLASAAIVSDLSETELRGLLDEIDNLESAPAEESEDVVRVSGSSLPETEL